MKKKNLMIFMSLVCLALMPVGADALPVSGTGMNGGGVTGSVDIGYSFDRLSTATPWLIISLTNSSANDTLFIAGYVLPGGAMSEIGLVRLGDTWTGRQPLFNADRGISVESIISGFVVLFSDAEGRLIDKAPVAVAEPSTMILLGFGFLAIGLGMRKRTK
ncbi:MAG: PEP-CTERM sorting domain-containing protein [Deltaproteobacteria bacterium]|nr:PEP-CTERM sorting domain-containing protein [Deltaproteobacteria bacterium]